jgi:ribosome-associated protein
MTVFTAADLLPEFDFRTSRSGGKGGQNVNKVSTKVLLSFNVPGSRKLDDNMKELVLSKLASRINGEGELQVVAQKERSQLANKELAIKKMVALLNKCFVEPKKRKATKPGHAAVEGRLQEKKRESERKKARRFEPDTE